MKLLYARHAEGRDSAPYNIVTYRYLPPDYFGDIKEKGKSGHEHIGQTAAELEKGLSARGEAANRP